MANTTTAVIMSCPDYNVYKCHDKGLLLPFVNEYTWPIEARAFIYLVGLFWCFLGVAIIADIFMCAIEKITSRTRNIRVANPDEPEGYEEIEVKVWNDTVANLTLMALGSSAPEILLSIIEICKNRFYAGELGPSTIVGSAAFNLLVITAVCMIAIPDGEIRQIKALKVFAVTSIFSLFAYIWLIIILIVVSPNIVELWEAILTFLFFPVLIILAYIADKDYCGRKRKADPQMELGFDEKARIMREEDANDEKMRDFIKELKRNHPLLSDDNVIKLAAAKAQEDRPHNRMWYRINATRALGGNPKLMPNMNEDLQDVYDSMKNKEPTSQAGSVEDIQAGSMIDMSEGGTKAVIEFTATRSAVLESDQRVRVGIRRYGKTSTRVLAKVETIDGTAESEKDYVPLKQTIVFEKDDDYKFVDIEIIDDNEWEPDEVFFVKLSLDNSDPGSKTTLIGKKAIQEVTIINDDEPGTFEFAKPSFLFKESAGKALIPIERSNGADGEITLSWKTEDMTAHSEKDYAGGEGTITFAHGEMSKTLEITIFDDQEVEKDECFKVELVDIQNPGAKIGRVKKTIVTIVNDDDFNGMVSRLIDLTNMNVDALRVGSTSWQDQFRNAMNVNGGDVENASHMDYLMHFVTFGWKILFAIVPPPSIWGGWLAFFIALIMIGLLTAVVGDLASIFGCLVGLKDSVTAITFVALGTSLPDLFASKQAATQEKTADNSIGNVTGSNSVNVFLGLGLPWLMAAIFWTAKGGSFKVQAGALGFSVAIYTSCALVCLGILVLRRILPVFGKAELGGTKIPKIICAVFCVFLWLFYVLMSSLQAYEHITVNF